MPTFFFAETMKYLYLTFTEETGVFNLDDYVLTPRLIHLQKNHSILLR